MWFPLKIECYDDDQRETVSEIVLSQDTNKRTVHIRRETDQSPRPPKLRSEAMTLAIVCDRTGRADQALKLLRRRLFQDTKVRS